MQTATVSGKGNSPGPEFLCWQRDLQGQGMGSRHFSGYVLSVVIAHKRDGGGVRWEEGHYLRVFFSKVELVKRNLT